MQRNVKSPQLEQRQKTWFQLCLGCLFPDLSDDEGQTEIPSAGDGGPVQDAPGGRSDPGGAGPSTSQPVTHLSAGKLDELLPPLVSWIERVEAQALDIGEPLDAEQRQIAVRAGVRHAEDVRLMMVSSIPVPKESDYVEVFSLLGMADLNGITYGRAIFVKGDAPNCAGVITHELKHVAQYEHLGIEGFLRQFVAEITQHSYRDAPLELEAIRFATAEGHPGV